MPFLPPNQQHRSTEGTDLPSFSVNSKVNVFSALTLLVGLQERHPACKKLAWLSV